MPTPNAQPTLSPTPDRAAHRDTTMHAVVRDRYGSPDVLALRDVARPVPSDAEVLVRVRAASANPRDWHLLRGTPRIVRLAGYGLRQPRHRGLGSDVAGQVEAVGKDVRAFRPGDEVFADAGTGAFAEYVCVAADVLAPKPTNLTFEQAAAVPPAALTALQGLRDVGRVKPGQQVLIVGASGGVGTFAVQLAKSFGAVVTGVCSTRNVNLVRSLASSRSQRQTPVTRRTASSGLARQFREVAEELERPVDTAAASWSLAPYRTRSRSTVQPGGAPIRNIRERLSDVPRRAEHTLEHHCHGQATHGIHRRGTRRDERARPGAEGARAPWLAR